eukprot:3788649-Rhodomonas_salina.1
MSTRRLRAACDSSRSDLSGSRGQHPTQQASAKTGHGIFLERSHTDCARPRGRQAGAQHKTAGHRAWLTWDALVQARELVVAHDDVSRRTGDEPHRPGARTPPTRLLLPHRPVRQRQEVAARAARPDCQHPAECQPAAAQRKVSASHECCGSGGRSPGHGWHSRGPQTAPAPLQVQRRVDEQIACRARHQHQASTQELEGARGLLVAGVLGEREAGLDALPARAHLRLERALEAVGRDHAAQLRRRQRAREQLQRGRERAARRAPPARTPRAARQLDAHASAGTNHAHHRLLDQRPEGGCGQGAGPVVEELELELRGRVAGRDDEHACAAVLALLPLVAGRVLEPEAAGASLQPQPAAGVRFPQHLARLVQLVLGCQPHPVAVTTLGTVLARAPLQLVLRGQAVEALLHVVVERPVARVHKLLPVGASPQHKPPAHRLPLAHRKLRRAPAPGTHAPGGALEARRDLGARSGTDKRLERVAARRTPLAGALVPQHRGLEPQHRPRLTDRRQIPRRQLHAGRCRLQRRALLR